MTSEESPSNPADEPRAVRAGEELDGTRLAAYLRERLPEIEGEVEIRQFPAGFSNLTYLVRVGSDEFVLRRPPFGSRVKTAHDVGREYLILSRLRPVYGKVPRPVLFCEDASVVGAPFYLMERVRGRILRARPPEGLELTPEVMLRLSEAFVENLVEIHGVDYEAAGLGELGRPEGYVRRQVEGWTRRYFDAKTDEVPAIERLAAWLAGHAPIETARAALIHNDYKYDNLVLAPRDLGRVVAVLDWEMATLGEPLMDLGTALGYWVDADDPEEWRRYGFGLTALAGGLTRVEVVERYANLSGRDVPEVVFYYAYGLLKIAGIVQQIYARYRKGLTRDERFASLAGLVRACGEMGTRALERNRIDRLG
ncbi:MAG TPA: phosphotransferase family protein [Pyrinomonadaceae bacterium]|nr:phosphotransferase family protein [Pyrinomonadaceae bacterium]